MSFWGCGSKLVRGNLRGGHTAGLANSPDTDLERAMRQTHQVRHRFEDDFALGLAWSVREFGGRSIVSHGGSTGGFQTMVGFDPERRVGFVLLTNSRGFGDDIGIDFLARGAPLSHPEVNVAPNVLAAYAGEYEVAPGPVRLRPA
jgi:CubicO group peptidase (beta-lactamase class C family)